MSVCCIIKVYQVNVEIEVQKSSYGNHSSKDQPSGFVCNENEDFKILFCTLLEMCNILYREDPV